MMSRAGLIFLGVATGLVASHLPALEAAALTWGSPYAPTRIEWLALKMQANLHSAGEKLDIGFEQEPSAPSVLRMKFDPRAGGPSKEELRYLLKADMGVLQLYAEDLKIAPPPVKLRIFPVEYDCKIPPFGSPPLELELNKVCKAIGKYTARGLELDPQ